MFGISYDTWKEICSMYFNLQVGTHKAYLQWFPFSKLSEKDKTEITGEPFYKLFIETGGIVLFPEVMRHSENFIQKGDGSFRNATLISPFLYLLLQAIGKEVSARYVPQRSADIGVYYAGNYALARPKYKQDYDEFYKAICAGTELYPYFIKTDIASFFGNINVNELINKIDAVCNRNTQTLSQTQLLLIKELLLYCGNGCFPLIENSMASSYMATVIYLDEVDCELHEFIEKKVKDIADFQIIRYVDDLYILFSSEKSIDQLTRTYNMIRNAYSSSLKKHGLALNTKKCVLKEISEIDDELKKSQYDEYVKGIEFDIGVLFSGTLEGFLAEVYEQLSGSGVTNEHYTCLIEKHFSFADIELTPEEVFNYLIYENQAELKRPEVTRWMIKLINRDISFLSIDPKRLTVMVMQSENDRAVKAMLNQLFTRYRAGLWNSYDTTIAIAYLIQSKFQHIDLLDVINENCPDLYAYYFYNCRTSFVNQVRHVKWGRYLRCINGDKKAIFLYFMNLCEQNRANYLGAYAYYKNFFDRISADMAFLAGVNQDFQEPNYNKYYKEPTLKALYDGIDGSGDIIRTAHKLRNANPLSHSSAGLIDSDSSSADLMDIREKLDRLICRYAIQKHL